MLTIQEMIKSTMKYKSVYNVHILKILIIKHYNWKFFKCGSFEPTFGFWNII